VRGPLRKRNVLYNVPNSCIALLFGVIGATLSSKPVSHMLIRTAGNESTPTRTIPSA